MGETVKGELKRLHSPDVYDLRAYKPNKPFGILVQALVGPLGIDGEESFDFVLCTSEWFAESMEAGIKSGRDHVFIREFDYDVLWDFVKRYCESCLGNSWAAVAQKLSRLGKWEFQDYIP